MIKYALQYGYKVTPIYTFGESRTFHTFTPLLALRLKVVRALGLPMCFFFGSPTCPLFPRYDAWLLTYVGAPLELPAIAEPTIEDVDKWHARYVAALLQLFDEHKAEAGAPHAQLEVL